MFATRRYHDVVGIFDAGLGSTIATSVSTSSLSGNLFDLGKFQKYIFTLYAYGTSGKPNVLIYSTANSASSLSSASSNWTVVDSLNLTATLGSAASTSTSQFAAVLEVRAEKLFSGTSPIQYIRPVVVMSSASSGSQSVNGYLTAVGLLPAYSPASTQENSGFVVAETDYL